MGATTSELIATLESCKNALKDSKGIERARIYERMGDAYMELEKAPKAAVFYRSAFDGGLSDPEFIDKFARSLVKSGKPEEARGILDKALQKDVDQVSRARLRVAYGMLENWIGNFEAAKQQCEGAISILAIQDTNAPENKRLIAEAYALNGRTLWRELRLEEALELLNKSLKMFLDLKNKQGLSEVYNSIGNVHYHMGELDKALEFYEKAHKIDDRAGYYNNAGLIRLAQGRFEEAEDLFRTGLKKIMSMGNTYDIPQVQLNLADLCLEKRETIKAKAWLDMADRSIDELGHKRLSLTADVFRGRIALMEGDLDKAWALAESTLAEARKEKRPGLEQLALRLQAHVKVGQGDLQTAKAIFQRAVEKSRKVGMKYEMACVLGDMARLLLDLGEKEDARTCMEEAREIFKGMSLEYELKKLRALGL